MFTSISELRAARNAAIAKTDFLLLPDIGMDDGAKAELMIHRQRLRDITFGVTEATVGDVALPEPTHSDLRRLLGV